MNYKGRIQFVLNSMVKPGKKYTPKVEWIAERMVSGIYESAWRLPAGYSYQDIMKRQETIAAACGYPVEIEDRIGAVVIRVMSRELPNLIDYEETDGILIGHDALGRPVHFTFKPHAHMLIGGETGMGKTDLIRLIAYGCLKSGEYEIDIVDMKAMSFMPFRNVKDLRIARDINEADEMIKDVVQLIKDRADQLWSAGRRTEYNKKRILIVDEAAELSPALFKDRDAKKFAAKIEANLSTVARLGREVGVHLIYATQYPTAQVVNNQIKVNCGARVCFYVPNDTNSEVVLDRAGAERLGEIPGRIIFKNTGYKTIQVSYVGGDDKWEELLEPYKEVVTVERRDPEHVPAFADGDYQTNSEVVQIEEPGETRIRKLKGVRTRWTPRKSKDGEYAEGVAAHQERQKAVATDVYDVSFA